MVVVDQYLWLLIMIAEMQQMMLILSQKWHHGEALTEQEVIERMCRKLNKKKGWCTW